MTRSGSSSPPTWLIEHAPKHVPDPWKWAAEHAIRLLDERRDACLAAMVKSNQMDAEHSALRKGAVDRQELAKTSRPFKQAVCKIVGLARWDRALPLFKKFLRKRPQMFEVYVQVVRADDRPKHSPDGQHKVVSPDDGEFVVPSYTKENLEIYAHKYLEAHSKGKMPGDEIARLRRLFLEVKGEINSDKQRGNAKTKKS